MNVFKQLLFVTMIASLLYAKNAKKAKKEKRKKENQCYVDGYMPCLEKNGLPDDIASNATEVTNWMLDQIKADKDDNGVSAFWKKVEECSKTEWPEYGEAFKDCENKWNEKVDNPKFDKCMKKKLCQV